LTVAKYEMMTILDGATQRLHITAQSARLERASHRLLEVIRIERLGDEVPRAGAHRANCGRHVTVGGDDDHHGRRRRELGEDAEPVDIRHREVEQHEVRREPFDRSERGAAIFGHIDVVPGRDQTVAHDLTDRAVVVCHQDACHQFSTIGSLRRVPSRGSTTRNSLPWPGELTTVTSPPWSRTRFRAIDSPRPVPTCPSEPCTYRRRSGAIGAVRCRGHHPGRQSRCDQTRA